MQVVRGGQRVSCDEAGTSEAERTQNSCLCICENDSLFNYWTYKNYVLTYSFCHNSYHNTCADNTKVTVT